MNSKKIASEILTVAKLIASADKIANRFEGLGIEDSREFGPKFKTQIEKIAKTNGIGTIVGYAMGEKDGEVLIIGTKHIVTVAGDGETITPYSINLVFKL